jgi:hypothetical protein
MAVDDLPFAVFAAVDMGHAENIGLDRAAVHGH